MFFIVIYCFNCFDYICFVFADWCFGFLEPRSWLVQLWLLLVFFAYAALIATRKDCYCHGGKFILIALHAHSLLIKCASALYIRACSLSAWQRRCGLLSLSNIRYLREFLFSVSNYCLILFVLYIYISLFCLCFSFSVACWWSLCF